MVDEASLCILVIEDDADTQANIRDILDLDGYRAIAASTFAEALHRDNWDDIGAVLTDRKLPDGVAEQMLPRLRLLAPHVPVVVVTGFPDVEGAIGALREGAYDYILKPINPDVLLASLRRIAERRRIEQALRDREERLRAILSTASDAILTIDEHGIVQTANPATERMFGYSAQEIVGQSIDLLLPDRPGGQQDGYFAQFVKLSETRNPNRNQVLTAERKNGAIFPIDLAISEVTKLRLYTLIVRDVSERRELQRQVLEIAAEEDRRIGHELHDNTQQQLTGLSLLAKSLADKLAQKSSPEAPFAKRLADEINETAKQVHLLSRGLVPVEVDAQGLRAALTELAYRISELHRIRCEFRCETPVAVADNFIATHLYRIAQEAVNNAMKHSAAKRIEISLANAQGNIILQISDDGIGIDEQRQFQPGTGLRIMRYRAGLIGASLKIEPGEPRGTMIKCTVWRAGLTGNN